VATVRVNLFLEKERWTKSLVLSLVFHALLGLTIFGLGFVLESSGHSDWGNNQGDAVVAQLVSGASIPIPPKSDAQTENIVANENKGVTETVPPPKPVETEDGITIPGKVTTKPTPTPTPTTTANVRPHPLPTPTTTTPYTANVRPHPVPTPTSAVPYGENGQPSRLYSSFAAPNTKGGFSAQNADFGGKYGWYVDTVKRTVQSNWLTYEIDPHINAPHRAYIDFDITKDGTPANIRLVQSSGVPTLDQSALRAVQRVDKFGALPEGSRQTFEFWFDYPPK
jgi:periplasmic protein TonB